MAARTACGIRYWALVAAVAGALALLAAVPGCKDKKKAAKKQQPQQAGQNLNALWGDIRSIGMEGKHWCEKGLKDCQEAATPEGRTAAYEMMVDGYKKIQEAANKADAFLAAMQKQSPGKDFTGYEDEVAGWQELLKPVKAMLPNEYLDKLHQ